MDERFWLCAECGFQNLAGNSLVCELCGEERLLAAPTGDATAKKGETATVPSDDLEPTTKPEALGAPFTPVAEETETVSARMTPKPAVMTGDPGEAKTPDDDDEEPSPVVEPEEGFVDDDDAGDHHHQIDEDPRIAPPPVFVEESRVDVVEKGLISTAETVKTARGREDARRDDEDDEDDDESEGYHTARATPVLKPGDIRFDSENSKAERRLPGEIALDSAVGVADVDLDLLSGDATPTASHAKPIVEFNGEPAESSSPPRPEEEEEEDEEEEEERAPVLGKVPPKKEVKKEEEKSVGPRPARPVATIKTKALSYVASFAVASEQGRRRTMEDVYMVNGSIQDDPSKCYFAVFDGHAGSRAAEYCGQRLLDNITSTAAWRRGDMKEAMRYGIQRTEQSYLRAALSASPRWFDGTTAVVCVVTSNVATLGWVGDSRAILGRFADGSWSAASLTIDHKPTSAAEHERIVASGGTVGRSLKEANARNVTAAAGARCPVFCFGAHPAAPMRCYPGGLSLSRSIGDVTLKYHSIKCVIGDPEVVVHNFDLTTDRFVILGCDGIWDVLTNEQAVNIVASATAKKQDSAKALVRSASQAGSTDNMTVIVVRLARSPTSSRGAALVETAP
ncbi:hypothetical protein CTAYLR_007813 [Chrysophaeum taylorii]|uniref:PPM-type phosphatase domain-containing protein n=1 Tax=Chrysophaeum taylorii TaxID=2483200 RepID=A0AAD7UJ66_9STRA|nr:hypothetical protein CTAYLR_007813 [Chrysophaeum taylorii]